MIASGEARRAGALVSRSHGSAWPGMRRFETMKPQMPHLEREPTPVADSSRISPPTPVAAPGKGEMAVGWLCVSTFIRMSTWSSSKR